MKQNGFHIVTRRKVIFNTPYRIWQLVASVGLSRSDSLIFNFAIKKTSMAGLHNGTIWEKCMWLKGVVMRAHFNGLIPRNPFAQFHISPNVKEREFLTEDELKVLMTHDLDITEYDSTCFAIGLHMAFALLYHSFLMIVLPFA